MKTATINLQRGSVLPICLALSATISLLAAQTLQSARIELMLARATLSYQQTFAITETGIGTALSWAAQNPGLLPLDHAQMTLDTGNTSATTAISNLGSDPACPEYNNGVRQHYEITSRLNTSSVYGNTHTQGFYICTETCSTNDCIGAISEPVKTWWYLNRQQHP